MSLSLASKLIFTNEEAGFRLFDVQTMKCAYRVCVYPNEGYCTITGPGVSEEFDFEDFCDELPVVLTHEAKALMAVLIFEEGD